MKTELFSSLFKKICVHTYRFGPSTLQRQSREKLHVRVCPPFWMLTVEWSGARSCVFWWRLRFQIPSFSPSTLENSVSKKHRFQIPPLWGAFSNGSVFGDRFWRCSVDNSRIRSNPEQNSSVFVWKRISVGLSCSFEEDGKEMYQDL